MINKNNKKGKSMAYRYRLAKILNTIPIRPTFEYKFSIILYGFLKNNFESFCYGSEFRNGLQPVTGGIELPKDTEAIYNHQFYIFSEIMNRKNWSKFKLMYELLKYVKKPYNAKFIYN